MVLTLPGSPYPRKVKPSSKPPSTAAWNIRTGRSISPNKASLLPSEPSISPVVAAIRDDKVAFQSQDMHMEAVAPLAALLENS